LSIKTAANDKIKISPPITDVNLGTMPQKAQSNNPAKSTWERINRVDDEDGSMARPEVNTNS
jgi:hypothetical protein